MCSPTTICDSSLRGFGASADTPVTHVLLWNPDIHAGKTHIIIKQHLWSFLSPPGIPGQVLAEGGRLSPGGDFFLEALAVSSAARIFVFPPQGVFFFMREKEKKIEFVYSFV